MSSKEIISCQDFTFRYDSQAEANLVDINFDIYKGETVLILGPSGSGKSTLAKAINGQLINSFPGEVSGIITVNGRVPHESSIFEMSLSTGTVLQDTDSQFVGITVAEDMAFALENDNVPQNEMKESVQKWAKTLDLDKLLTNRPQQLSGGQKQRVSIAGVLINEVPIMVFDEPLANLDPKSGRETLQLINQLSQDLNLTTLIIEHRLEECLLADIDRVLVMDEGHLVMNGSVDELLRSDILDEIGLRKPLYLSALEEAGVKLSDIDKLGAYEKTELSSSQLDQVENWVTKLEKKESPTSDETVLSVEDVSFRYARQKTRPLTDISFKIQKGDMVSIIGTNGAGKSTLAKLICGFERAQSGDVLIKGQSNKELSIKEIADSVGFVLQNPNTMISQTMIYDEVALGLVNRGLDPKEIEERVHETLKICGLYPYRNWPISALSYGQKRRVTIASILVLNPEIIILDEPTAGQDYKNYTSMMEFIKKLNVNHGLTVMMITHDMHLMQEYTKRALVFDEGELIADTTPAIALSDEEIIERASLAQTSLYQLADDLKQVSRSEFLEAYLAHERGVKNE